MAKRIALFVGILSLGLITGCNPLTETSAAYQFGKETGSNWRELSNEVREISSWADELGTSTAEIPEVDKLAACRAMWLIVGWPQFGLENSSENRSDFIDGCLTTIGD